MSDLIKISTPLGKLIHVSLDGSKKNYDESKENQFCANIILSTKASADLRKEIQSHYDDFTSSKYTLKSLPFLPCDEKGKTKNDDGEKLADDKNTTHYMFAFKTNITYSDGKPKVINTYNAKGVQVALGNVRIGNGSLGIINGAMKYYTYKTTDGISLYLNSVQIGKLVKYDETVEAIDGLDDEDAFDGVDDEFTGVAVNEQGKNSQPDF